MQFSQEFKKQMFPENGDKLSEEESINRLCCICIRAFISWCECGLRDLSSTTEAVREAVSTFFGTISDAIDAIYEGVLMLEKKEETEVYLKIKLGEKEEEEIYINHFLELSLNDGSQSVN